MADRTILVLDENDTSRVFLATTLRKTGYQTLEASSANEALILAWRDDPDLILFDPVLPDIKVEEFIQKLRRDPRTSAKPLIALSSAAAPELRDICVNAGVAEYFYKSPQALMALGEAVERILSAETPPVVEEPVAPAEKKTGALIVFLSAKGGTGTSSLCANLAMNIKVHEPEAGVVMADLVLPIGSLAQIVGYQGPVNLVTVADLPPEQTDGEYFHNNLPRLEAWPFQLLAGSPDPQHGNTLKGGRIGQIIQVLRSSYDYILLDLGRSLSSIALPLIQQADLIILIVSTDQSTIHLTRTVTEYLKSQGVDPHKIYAILNRAVGLEGLTKSEAEGIIGIPIQMTVPYMGDSFTLANNLNQPITIKYPRDTASFVLRDATESMIQFVQSQRTRMA